MPTLELILRGVNAYIVTENKIVVVMPNATRLGQSERSAPGTADAGASHFPTIWEESDTAPKALSGISRFPGRQMVFGFSATRPPLIVDPAVSEAARTSWLEVSPDLVGANPEAARVSGQLVIDGGHVTKLELPRHCRRQPPKWKDPSNLSLQPIVYGLKVRIESTGGFELNSTDGRGPRRTVEQGFRRIYIGNICAEDLVRWPQPVHRDASPGYTLDVDFNWIYMLRNELHRPRLEVAGSDLRDDMTPQEIFAAFRGEGGGTGCECNGVIGKIREGRR